MSYFDAACDYRLFNKTVNGLVARIKRFAPNASAVAARGLSGSLVVMAVAAKLKKPAMIIRKRQEVAHSSAHPRIGVDNATNYIIVDDFVSTGATVDAIMEGVESCTYSLTPDKCIGVFEYEDKHYGHVNGRKHITPNGHEVNVFAKNTSIK